MSKGAPDYSKMVLLQALDGSGNLIPVLLDSTGKIISVLQGLDGSTLRTLKVDGTGQMYTLIKGSSGEAIAVDATGNLSAAMKGLDGATLRTVAVDASGNIIGVLKGDYGGTLKTLATDAEGRLLAKLYDPLNVFGNNINIGLAELANRIKAPMQLDKRGEIAWYDNFEAAVLKWTAQTSGAGSAVVLDTTRAHEGDRACKLTTGSASMNYAMIRHGIYDLSGRRVGGQMYFSPSSGFVANGYVDLCMWQQRGSACKVGELRIYGDGTVQVDKAPYTWQTVASLGTLSDAKQTWYSAKLVIDYSTGKYVRAIVGTEEYDLSAYSLNDTTGSGANWLETYVILWTNAAATAEIYVDSVIVTANEP